MLRRAGAVLAVALLAAALAAVTPSPARAAPPTSTTLPFDVVRDVLVDPVTERVFVSGGDHLVALDLDGTIVDSRGNKFGAASMVLHDGDLYLALANTGVIERIDPSTLAVTGRWETAPLPVSGRPMAWAGDKLWFSTGAGASIDTQVVSLDPASNRVTGHDLAAHYSPALSSAGGSSSTLIAFDYGLSPTTIYKYDVSGPAPSLLATHRTRAGNAGEIAVAPAGDVLWLAAGSPYRIDQYRMSDLALTGRQYETGAYPRAVAVTGTGDGIAAGLDGIYNNDVHVFPAVAPRSAGSWELSAMVPPNGLAFSPDGSRVYAATLGRLHVLTVDPPVVTSAAPARGTRDGGTPITITGSRLTGAVAVRFGDTPARRFEVRSDTEIVAVPPAMAPGTYPVTVSGPFGTSVATDVTYAPDDTLTPRGAFIEAVYADLIDRPPTVARLEHWSLKLEGGLDRGAFTDAIALGKEGRDRRIAITYATYLGRPPDRVGRSYWRAHLLGGGAFDVLESSLLGSSEYRDLAGGGDGALLDALYSDVLGRRIDSAGRRYWLDQLRRGTSAATVAATLVRSQEALTNRTVAAHLDLFDRTPTSTERSRWRDQLVDEGGDVDALRSAMAATDEYADLPAG